MDKAKDISLVRRNCSQLKILARLLEYEVDAADGKDITIDRDLGESILDTLEIYIEGVESGGGSGNAREGRNSKGGNQKEKPAVTRLN